MRVLKSIFLKQKFFFEKKQEVSLMKSLTLFLFCFVLFSKYHFTPIFNVVVNSGSNYSICKTAHKLLGMLTENLHTSRNQSPTQMPDMVNSTSHIRLSVFLQCIMFPNSANHRLSVVYIFTR